MPNASQQSKQNLFAQPLSHQSASAERQVVYLEIGDEDAGQRLDNYLLRVLKGVPKSHVYRILRSGELRVNSRRSFASYRLKVGDRLRLPPLRWPTRPPTELDVAHTFTSLPLLFEDAGLIAVDKPAGLAVHGGSGICFGVIELLRRQRPAERFLELVHRLDRATSGVLLVAKKRSVLRQLHAALRAEGESQIEKRYLALVRGRWMDPLRHVRVPLVKLQDQDGQRFVRVAKQQEESVTEANVHSAHSVVRLLVRWREYSLLEVELKTGRTHQIRVHLAHLGYPVLGDEKYGDFALNKKLKTQGLKRMALHAWKLEFEHPQGDGQLKLEAPLPDPILRFVRRLGEREFAVAVLPIEAGLD